MALCTDENNVCRQLSDRHSILSLARESCLPVAKLWALTIDPVPEQSPSPGILTKKEWQGSRAAHSAAFHEGSWDGTTGTSDQIRSVTQLGPTLCDPMNCSMPGLPVRHQLPEFTQTHVHRVGDAIQPSHPLSSPSPPAPNPSQHQGLFQWVNYSHEMAKVLEFQLQHQSFQWTSKTDLL